MNLILFPATILVVMAILAFSIILARRQANKFVAAQLQSAEGKVHLDEDASAKGGTAYFVYIGAKKFTFGEDMSRVFKEGEKYRVYYCKSGMYEFVLSLEKMNS